MVSKSVLQDAVNAVVLANGNKTQAASDMGVARTTFLGWLDQAEREGVSPTVMSPNMEAELAKVKLQYESEIRALQRQLAEATREGLSADLIRRYVFELSERQAAPPSWMLEEPGEHQPGIPTISMSDFHWGEVVNLEEMNGINEFNLEIARQRLQRLVANSIDVLKNHIAFAEFPGVILLLGGDMVSGDIHEELRITNDKPIMPVLFDLFDNMVWAINQYADAFGNVTIYTAFGNHGRAGDKRFKSAAETNFDWMLYNMLERHYKAIGEKRVTFHISNSFDIHYKVYNQHYLLTHGDRIGSGGGNGIIGMLGPVIRGAKKIVSNYNIRGVEIGTVVMGHWHNRVPLDMVRVNGTLKGYDEFAMGNRFDPSPPVQDMWITHPRHGITLSAPIILS